MILFQGVGLRSTELGILGWKQKIMKHTCDVMSGAVSTFAWWFKEQ